MGNPIAYVDESGKSSETIFVGGWETANALTTIDGPLPYGDVIGLIIGVIGSAVAGGVWLGEQILKYYEGEKE